MRAFTTIVVLAAASVALVAGEAPVVSKNPAGVTYKASLDGDVSGSITAASGIDGYGVVFKVEFEDLDEKDGPFGYHIHAKPVPSDGNCTGTGGHLNPYNASSPCNKAKLADCEVGDLSGKHGKVNGSDFETAFVDLWASTDPDDPAFFGSLSFVIHRNDSSRLACANFELVESASNCSHTNTSTTTSVPYTTSTTVSPPTTSPIQTTPAAADLPLPRSSATRSATSILGFLIATGLMTRLL